MNITEINGNKYLYSVVFYAKVNIMLTCTKYQIQVYIDFSTYIHYNLEVEI